jgi:hypothetical protein
VDPTARSDKRNITNYEAPRIKKTSTELKAESNSGFSKRKSNEAIENKSFLQANLGLVKWARDKKSIMLKVETLIVFISKIRTSKASGVEFHNHSQFCDYLDQMKSSDIGVGDQINYMSLDPKTVISLSTFNYRSDFDFLVGFNVEGFNLDYNFWKTINEMCLDPSYKLPPFGFYLGLVSAGCVDPPLRLESFYNSLKDSLGPLGFSRLCSENDRLMRDLTIQINKVKGTCPAIIEKINSKYLIKSLCLEDSLFKEINDKLKSINYFQGFLGAEIIDSKIRMIKGLFIHVDEKSKTIINNFEDFTTALGIKTAYSEDDNFYEILESSLTEIFRNIIPLFIALDYDEASTTDSAAEISYRLYSFIEIIKKMGLQKSATKLDTSSLTALTFIDPSSASHRHALIFQTVKAFFVTMKKKIPDPVTDEADLCKRLELINYSPIEEYSRIASLIIDIDPKDPVSSKNVETILSNKGRALLSPDEFFSVDKLHPMWFRGGGGALKSKIDAKKAEILQIQSELAALSGDKTRVDKLVGLVIDEFDSLKVPTLPDRGDPVKNEALAEDTLIKLLRPKIANSIVEILRLKADLERASPAAEAAASASSAIATATGPAAAVAATAPKTVDGLIAYYQGLLKDKLAEKIVRKPTDPPILDLTPDSKEYPMYVQIHLILRYIYINCIPIGYKFQNYSKLIKETAMPIMWYSDSKPCFYSIFKSICYSFTKLKPGENESKLYSLDFEAELLVFVKLIGLIDDKSCGNVVDTLNVFSKKAHHLLEEHKGTVDGLLAAYKDVDTSKVVSEIDTLAESISGVDDDSEAGDSSDSSWARKAILFAHVAGLAGAVAAAGVPLATAGAVGLAGLGALAFIKRLGEGRGGFGMPNEDDATPGPGGKRRTIKHKHRKSNRRSTMTK